MIDITRNGILLVESYGMCNDYYYIRGICVIKKYPGFYISNHGSVENEKLSYYYDSYRGELSFNTDRNKVLDRVTTTAESDDIDKLIKLLSEKV